MATTIMQDRESFSMKFDKDKIVVQESYNLITSSVGEPLDLSGLPTVGSIHPLYSNLAVQSFIINNFDGRTAYKVVVTYESFGNSLGGGLITQWSFDISSVQFNYDRDRLGNPITNSSGEPSPVDVSKNIALSTFSGFRPLQTADIPYWISLVGKLNSNTWSPASNLPTFEEKTVQCTGISISNFYKSSSALDVTFKFLYDPKGHMLEFLDQGYKYYDTTQANRVVFSYENIDKEPQRLNGYGGLFGQSAQTIASQPQMGTPAGATRKPLPNPGTPSGIYLVWDIYESTDFSLIGLD